MYTNLMVIDLLFYNLYRPAKKSSIEKYKKNTNFRACGLLNSFRLKVIKF